MKIKINDPCELRDGDVEPVTGWVYKSGCWMVWRKGAESVFIMTVDNEDFSRTVREVEREIVLPPGYRLATKEDRKGPKPVDTKLLTVRGDGWVVADGAGWSKLCTYAVRIEKPEPVELQMHGEVFAVPSAPGVAGLVLVSRMLQRLQGETVRVTIERVEKE